MNRPQFWWSTPSGYKDIPYVRPVTPGQDPFGSFTTQQYVNSYTVPLDNDADQVFRSLFIQGIQQGQQLPIQMQMRDAAGVYLTDGYVPLWLYAWGAGSTPPDGGSGRCKVFEPELFCPRGGMLLLDFYFPGTGTTGPWPPFMELRGVKRYPIGSCPQ